MRKMSCWREATSKGNELRRKSNSMGEWVIRIEQLVTQWVTMI